MAGPTPPCPGVSGTLPVTGAPVQVGDYVLSESGGPAGYTASDWSCVGAPIANGTVTIALDQDVTCTITNTAVAPTLTLVKTVTNTSGGTAQPTDWLLSATGGVTISGAGGRRPPSRTPSCRWARTRWPRPAAAGGYTALLRAWSGPSGLERPDVRHGHAGGRRRRERAPSRTPTGPPPSPWPRWSTARPRNPGKCPLRLDADGHPGGAITGQGPVTGNGDPTSSGGVNAVPVFSGAYDLSESGPPGFTSGTWVCEGGVVTGVQVVIASRRGRSLHHHQHRRLPDADLGQAGRRRERPGPRRRPPCGPSRLRVRRP